VICSLMKLCSGLQDKMMHYEVRQHQNLVHVPLKKVCLFFDFASFCRNTLLLGLVALCILMQLVECLIRCLSSEYTICITQHPPGVFFFFICFFYV